MDYFRVIDSMELSTVILLLSLLLYIQTESNCGGWEENGPQKERHCWRCDFVRVGVACWRKCVTMGVGLGFLLIRLSVTQSSVLVDHGSRRRTLRSFSSTMTACMLPCPTMIIMN